MFSPFTVLGLFFGYMLLLFLVARWVEKQAALNHNLASNPWVYSLSLGIYCTAWTYYGSVGKATLSGFLFFGVYLGPTCAMFLWWLLVRKMIRLKSDFRITSLADLLAARYGKSLLVGALVSLIALFGTLPYIALQLKSILTSFHIISGTANVNYGPLPLLDITILVLLIGFICAFGLRRIDPTERHQGMMVIIAFESLFKLLALMVIGVFVTFFLYDGINDILQQAEKAQLSRSFDELPNAYVNWFSFLLLSVAAIIFLPRQFHVAVVENSDERHLATAVWFLPLYLLLITLFAVPIAMAGLLSGLPASKADFFVLHLPLQAGQPLLSLLAFLGGFSAATSMIMVTSMAMAIMLSNYLLQPLLHRFTMLAFLRRQILPLRWLIVTIFIFFGYGFYRLIGNSYMLVNIGIFSFVAILQFVPVTICGLFWRQANRSGALLALSGGFCVWFYTIIVPALIHSGWVAKELLDNGPWGIALLRPEHLLGLQVLPAIPHAIFWSMIINIGGLLIGSLIGKTTEDEIDTADRFVNSLSDQWTEPQQLTLPADIDLDSKLLVLHQLLEQYFRDDTASRIIRRILDELDLTDKKTVSILSLSNLFDSVETVLTGAIGAASAHSVLSQTALFLPDEREALSQTYREMMVSMRISPLELKQKISYYKERDDLLTSHARALEEKIWERDKEIASRQMAEIALMESKERFQELADLLPEIVYETDLSGRLTYANQAAFSVTGYGPSDLEEGFNITDIIAPEDQSRARANFRMLLNRQFPEKREYKIKQQDGRHFYAVARSALILRDGRPVGVRGILVNIDDLKQTEHELRQLRNLLRNIIDSMPSLVIGVDLSGKITQWNQQAAGFTGSSFATAHGRPLIELFPQLQPIEDQLLQAIKNQQPLEKLKMPLQVDSLLRHMNLTLYPLHDAESQGAVIRIDDVTERIKIEETMVQTEKMLSVGGLAAGMAHEINNPLAGILQSIQVVENRLNSQLAKNRKVADECDIDLEAMHNYMTKRRLPEMFTAVKGAAQRAAKIVDNMLSFSRKSDKDFAPHALADLLDRTLDLISNDYSLQDRYDFRQVEIHRDFDAQLPKVPCESSQIQQVLLNLFKNGAQAMMEWEQQTEQPCFSLRLCRRGDMAQIEIADNGPGMNEETRRRIFEPFSPPRGLESVPGSDFRCPIS